MASAQVAFVGKGVGDLTALGLGSSIGVVQVVLSELDAQEGQVEGADEAREFVPRDQLVEEVEGGDAEAFEESGCEGGLEFNLLLALVVSIGQRGRGGAVWFGKGVGHVEEVSWFTPFWMLGGYGGGEVRNLSMAVVVLTSSSEGLVEETRTPTWTRIQEPLQSYTLSSIASCIHMLSHPRYNTQPLIPTASSARLLLPPPELRDCFHGLTMGCNSGSHP